MKSAATAVILAVLLFGTSTRGQEKSGASGKKRQATPLKLVVTLTEYDGEKKVSSLPYALLLNSEAGDTIAYTTFARTGVRVPVPGIGTDGKAQFVDVGANIDCGVRTEEDGRFSVRLNFERSSLYFQGQGEEKGTARTGPGGQPYLPTIRAQSLVTIKDGQTVEALMAADPLNGHVFRISLNLNVQK